MDSWEAPNEEYAPPKPGEPPLHRSAREGDSETIRELAHQGADVNALFNIRLDPSARPVLATPLMVAAGSGDGATPDTVELLLELGADPTLVLDGHTAASFAASGLGWNYRPGGDASRLRRLLHAGSPLPPDPTEAHRLLHDVASEDDVERLEVLLDHGMSAKGYWDIKQIESENRAAMESLADSYLAESFENNIPEDMKDEFIASIRTMDEEIYGVGQEGPFSFQIPIFGAVQCGSLRCFDLLVQHGADLAVRDRSARTAMYYASSESMIRALIAAGVPLEDNDEFGWSPLVSALSDCDALSKIQALLAAGADVNAVHDHGYTVLMSAVGSDRNLEVLHALVAAGADPHAVSEYGYSAFHAAIDINGEGNAAESVRETLGFLKQLGLDIEGRTSGDQTPLARAISVGTAIEVRVLCELGADTNAVCKFQLCGDKSCTDRDLPMLFHGVRGSGVETDQKVDSLLAFGADPLVADTDGHRPLIYAIAELCSESGSYEKWFRAFFEGLKKFETVRASLPAERDAYIKASTAWFQSYVERFAADIPLSDSTYAQEFRTEHVACVSSLCGYESWLRKDELSAEDG